MVVSAKARGVANRRKGHDTERDVAKYLRNVGFPHCERAVRTGYTTADHSLADPLDLTGVPGVLWSVKGVRAPSRGEIARWLGEAENARNVHGADLAVLVLRRHGVAEPSQWWAWVSLPSLARAVLGERHPEFAGYACVALGDLAAMLRRAGYGDETVEDDATGLSA